MLKQNAVANADVPFHIKLRISLLPVRSVCAQVQGTYYLTNINRPILPRMLAPSYLWQTLGTRQG